MQQAQNSDPMKKISSKSKEYIETILADLEAKEPYEIIYADPRDEEIHLKFLKRAQINARMARWFLEHEYNRLIWSDGIYETLEIDPRKHGASFSNFLEVVHHDDREIKTRAQEDLKTNIKPIEINYRLQFFDGRIKWINEICSTDFDTEGNPIRSYGTLQDITNFKLAEEQYKQKEEQYNRLTDAIPSLVGIIQNNKLVFVNRTGAQILKEKTNKKINQLSIARIIPKNSRKNFNQKMKSLKIGEFETTFNEKMLRLDGLEFDADIKLIRTTHNGNYAVQIIVNDITSKRENEESQKKNEKKFQELTENISANEIRLKELIETKDKFFSIIAHDLRSPFNNIIGILELLMNEYEDFNDSERKSYLSIIDNDANRTLKLLDDLLNWAKLQTGKISFQPFTQKLLPIVESVICNFTSAIELKQIKLSYSISDEFEIYADPHMLVTILQNLISNAIKYSNPYGNITINARSTNNNAEIIVSDNGIGMNKETRNMLFRIDQQASIPGTSNEQGSGFGLILCKDFIEKHKGKIGLIVN